MRFADKLVFTGDGPTKIGHVWYLRGLFRATEFSETRPAELASRDENHVDKALRLLTDRSDEAERTVAYFSGSLLARNACSG